MKKESDFKKIWSVIEPFVLILFIWTLVTTLFPIQKYLGNVLSSILTWVIQIGCFVILGFELSKSKDKISAAKYGAWLGAILGLFFALIGIFSFYFFPANYQEAINVAIQAGADASLVNLFVKIGLYFNLIFTPLITGAISALITWLSYMLFRKSSKIKK